MEGLSSIDALGMRSAVNTGEDEENSDDDEADAEREEEEKKLTDERNKLIALAEEKVGE